MKRKTRTGIIISIAVLLLIVLLMDIWVIFRQIRQQTKDAGISHLESISRELEESINAAKNLTMEIAIEAREHLDNKDALEKYIIQKKKEVIEGGTSAFNVYVAGKDWWFIPDFDAPDDYIAQERLWYKGAIRNGGKVYLSSPYQDAMTGDICYTVSVMLGDGETVIAVDYKMDTIQSYVERIYDEEPHHAVIVTDDGIIAGCSEEGLIGEKLSNAMPEFTGIWSLSRNSDDVVSTRIRSDFLYENLFAVESGNDWILVVSISDWDLLRTSYLQLFITIILLSALFITVIIAIIFARRSQKRAGEDALQRKKYQEPSKKQEGRGVTRRYRNRILAFMIVIMLISLYTIVTATLSWGNAQMRSEVKEYEHSLSNWIDRQKSILDMFVSTIASNPDMLKDYDETVRFLDGITQQFPEISVSYLTNPDLEPAVFMNNGWKPDDNVNIEERPWYVGAMESDTLWYMTVPYIDERTGGYCVTISEQVHDAKTGAFIGVFGIDFYMDKLVEILGDSYSDGGYAFLADNEGYIINHPYGKYQMSQDNQTSVLELPYGNVKKDGRDIGIIRDYDGSLKTLIATVNETSRFSVYVVSNVLRIYGRVILYASICLSAFLICIILIYQLLSGMIAWQEEVNLRLEKAAQTDTMTGLLNKTNVEAAILKAVKQGTGALLIIDLDSFKLVNDLYSHKMGDRILIRFAALIQSVIRDSDLAGRIGGDEFTVYFDGLTDENTIRKKCEFLNSEIIKSAREYMGSEMGIPLGCSAGVALVPQSGRDYSILFARADLALHQIKRSGKHDVRFYHEQEEAHLEESSDLSNLRMIFGERNLKKTAMVVDRELFQDIYRAMVRLASVNRWDLHLIEITLKAEEGDEPSGCAERFIELSSRLLRNCDVIMRYNDSQVIFLLMEPEDKDYMVPVDRVLKAWEQDGMPGVKTSYLQEQIVP